MTDLERAIAVIADLCGAGRPAVKESAEELAAWAEEFTDRYFQQNKPVSLSRCQRLGHCGFLDCICDAEP